MPNRPHGLSRPLDGVDRWPRWEIYENRPLNLVGWTAVTARTPAARRVVLEALRVAATIFEARRDRGWSKRELADRIGVSRQTLGNIEAGRTFPDFATLVLVADALKVDLTIEAKPPLPPAYEPPKFVLEPDSWSKPSAARQKSAERLERNT